MLMMQDVSAVYFLGICHERGLGTACNEAKAAELYRFAASHGHVGALHNLAVFFENGIGGIVCFNVLCLAFLLQGFCLQKNRKSDML